MSIHLAPFTTADAEAHVAGEDEETRHWLTGHVSTVEGTRAAVAELSAPGVRKRAFGVWVNGRLGGYVDADPGVEDGTEDGDVHLTYAVHPWARRQGVAVAAIGLLLEEAGAAGMGTHAVIRVDVANAASIGVAERAGFTLVREFTSGSDVLADGSPARLRLYRHALPAGRR